MAENRSAEARISASVTPAALVAHPAERRARIALVAPGPEPPGGQGIQARALLERLQGDGYEVTLLPINPPFPASLRWLRRRRYLRSLLNQALYLPSLARLRRADLVHVFSASYWSFLLSPVPALLTARGMGRRVVLHYHSGEAEDHLQHWGLLVHPWLRLADAIVVPSRYLQEVFARHGYRTRVIRNVVDTSRFRFRQRVPLRPRLLSTRNLDPYYRVDNTLRAFARLRERYPEATLVVAGCGSEEGRLRRLADTLGGGVRFAGPVAREAMPDLCNEADLFLNSSVLDNQPVAVLEAFASGLPVVSTGVGDLAGMIRDGETGLIVPPNDPEAMAAAVAGLLDDAERARRMALQARREVERYTWAAVRGEWASVYSAEQPQGRAARVSVAAADPRRGS